jgi:SAM-dependent methyltransferase
MAATVMPSTWNHNVAYHPWILDQARQVRGRCLDVGCGDGLLVSRLSSLCAEVTGIDSDPAAIARATARTAGRGNVTLRVGSFLTAELPVGGFDLVTLVASLHHMDLRGGLSRSAELLAPGGRLLVVGLSRPRSPVDWLVGGLSVPVVRVLDRLHGPTADDGATVLADPAESRAEIRRVAVATIPGARIRRGLYHRYLLSWTRP